MGPQFLGVRFVYALFVLDVGGLPLYVLSNRLALSVILTNALHGKGDLGEGGGCPEYQRI